MVMERLIRIASISTAVTILFSSAQGYAAERKTALESDRALIEVIKDFGVAEESNQNLDSIRGMSSNTFTAETLGVAVLEGISSGNTALGGVTGTNSISGNAFYDARGVSFVVQNSGNNAVVNAAMVVNLSLSK